MLPRLWLSDTASIPSYLLFGVIGFDVGVLVAWVLAGRVAVPRKHVLILCGLSLVIGLAGAHLLQVLTHWSRYAERPEKILNIFGARAAIGGPLLVLPFLLWYSWQFRLNFGKVLDVLVPGLVVGIMFGRIGCFLSGCCHGAPTDSWTGVVFVDRAVPPEYRGLPLHPTQLYEAAGLLVIFLAMMLLWSRRTWNGQICLSLCLAYPPFRFVLEFFRGDPSRGTWLNGWLSTSQFVSVLIFAAALLVLLLRWRWQVGLARMTCVASSSEPPRRLAA
jgi:phosphatidylglycerol:prolipoprotein diacylglycerol transferase